MENVLQTSAYNIRQSGQGRVRSSVYGCSIFVRAHPLGLAVGQAAVVAFVRHHGCDQAEQEEPAGHFLSSSWQLRLRDFTKFECNVGNWWPSSPQPARLAPISKRQGMQGRKARLARQGNLP